MALPCTQYQFENWERRCYDIQGRRVPCSQLDQAELAAGQYEVSYFAPDGSDFCYGGTVTDVGDDVVDSVHGVIEHVTSEVRDGLIFWGTVAFTGALFLTGSILLLNQLRKL